MYHPFFRGKQNELIAIRESAGVIKAAGFVPVIEPVKQSLNALRKTVESLKEESVDTVFVINPFYGDHAQDCEDIREYVSSICLDSHHFSAGILLREETALMEAVGLCGLYEPEQLVLIHSGFLHSKELVAHLGNSLSSIKSLFLEGRNGKLYQKKFSAGQRFLLRDGFESRRNRDHPPVEFFSDLHITYPDEGMDGFGDYLIVGDDYKESGGPAYAIAIHITYLDANEDDVMNVYHFLSDRIDTPTDPAGKFGEALDKLIVELGLPTCQILETSAIKEFKDLHNRGHYPGLGYVKKLSMKHHIETLADYFKNNTQ